MITIDIETISGVPFTGLLNTHAPDDVGDDEKAQQNVITAAIASSM